MLLCGILVFPLNLAAEDNDAFVEFVVGVKEEPANHPRMQTVRVHYRVNKIVIDSTYMNNAQALGMLDSLFTEHSAEDIAYIVITGAASPEGPPRNNKWLSEERAAALKNRMMATCPGLQNDQIVIIPRGEDWEGLEAMVENDPNVPNRAELLRILRSRLTREEQKKRMTTLGTGRSYAYLKRFILPQLRGGVTGMIYFREKPVLVVDTVVLVRVDTVYLPYVKEKKPFYIAIKNNLIYDLALLPNLAIEVPFGKDYKWSAAVEGNWSWWKTKGDRKKYNYNYHRIQMAGVELRRWFRNRTGNPLNGWYVGIYGYGGDFDLRLFARKNSHKGQQSLWSYSAGLTAGYAMPIARRWNLEFGLGGGYLGGKYKKYDVSDCRDGVFPVLSTHRRNYIGLTKANISLVWLIGSGVNKNNRKGERYAE